METAVAGPHHLVNQDPASNKYRTTYVEAGDGWRGVLQVRRRFSPCDSLAIGDSGQLNVYCVWLLLLLEVLISLELKPHSSN